MPNAVRRQSGVISVFGMVNGAPGFVDTPRVIDGCSDLFLAVFGTEVGRHARSAIGVAELPFDLPVESRSRGRDSRLRRGAGANHVYMFTGRVDASNDPVPAAPTG